MAYEKRVCVLKQVKRGWAADGGELTGAVYAERFGGELTVTPKVAGVAPVKEGRYALAVWVGGKIFYSEWKKEMRVREAPSLTGGFAALLCFLNREIEPVAYGFLPPAPAEYTALLGALSESGKLAVQAERETAADNGKEKGEPYDDEAIATDDYFLLSEGGEDERSPLPPQEETEKEQGDRHSCQNDGALPPLSKPSGTLAYYKEVRERLKAAFRKYPRHEGLTGVFPTSEWVNVGGALLGVVYKEGIPRYLCVAKEAETLPEEMKEHGVFVPKTHFSDGEGYFVVFQSADTGEYVDVYGG